MAQEFAEGVCPGCAVDCAFEGPHIECPDPRHDDEDDTDEH